MLLKTSKTSGTHHIKKIDFSKMHILCSKWGSFDSEFYADHEYFDMLADLMPLLVKPTDKKLIIIEKKTISSLIHKESQHTGLQTSKNDLYRMIADVTRIPSLVSTFTPFGFSKNCIIVDAVHAL